MTRIVIVGGGLSGLSLAAHLAVLDHRHPVVVADDGSRPLSGMTWASWSARPGLLDAAASRWFDRIRAHVNGRTKVLELGRYRYRVVRGDDFAAVVRRFADPLRHFTFLSGHVDQVQDDGVIVDGRHMRARWVFDSVIGPAAQPPVDAQLVFRGWRVRTVGTLTCEQHQTDAREQREQTAQREPCRSGSGHGRFRCATGAQGRGGADTGTGNIVPYPAGRHALGVLLQPR
ncbi:lycopene cyclase family protein [Lentzea kentuckyensis]|uniref:lycopene cyclase family protein n=1 Tax=Lentzea kentuckyensis TaxID=360086 RepID=UPI000A369796|nr:lycopene cyclase family protein [Lentzea kentuckyensis]